MSEVLTNSQRPGCHDCWSIGFFLRPGLLAFLELFLIYFFPRGGTAELDGKLVPTNDELLRRRDRSRGSLAQPAALQLWGKAWPVLWEFFRQRGPSLKSHRQHRCRGMNRWCF